VSIEHNKALVRRYFEQVVNQVDQAAAEELVAADLVLHSPYTPQPTRDRASSWVCSARSTPPSPASSWWTTT
jgi:ketosteroid isomerase-like protein